VVKSAAASQPEWSAIPVVERVRVLFKFRQIMLERLKSCAVRHAEQRQILAGITRERAARCRSRRVRLRRAQLLMGSTLANIARNVDRRDDCATP